MQFLSFSALIFFLFTSCNPSSSSSKREGSENQSAQVVSTKESSAKEVPNNDNLIISGTYMCWQNNQASLSGRDLLGEITVNGNSYDGDVHGNGKYSFDPSTKIVRFDGGGFDQRKNGKEWIGIFYRKGEKFIDDSDGTAANTMLIITSLADWNNGFKKAWIQQCDLK